MSDDERIARCTQLARRVWPDVKSVDAWRVNLADGPGESAAVWVRGDCAVLDIDSVRIPGRALEALEAALLVLAGEPPAWVERIASEWQRREMVPPAGIVLRECAAELRARAKER